MRSATLVLGLGNELFTDEGIGIVAARTLAKEDLPEVDVVDGGTLGLALLPTIESREALLVLDAISPDGRRPGDVVVLDGESIKRESRLLYSAHQLGVTEVLAAADLAGVAPGRLAAVGMVPASMETGYGLSDVAIKALPEMLDRALDILASWKEPAHA